jgi:ubiquinone/menaquinone biosynthesis C-methylase UbiE
MLGRLQAYCRARMIRDYDRLMEPLERRAFAVARERLASAARGRVLDLGAGTGANFAHYSRAAELVVAIDPELGMLAKAARRVESAGAPVTLVAAAAERLPFGAAAFDTVVATLVFCTIGEPERAMAEVARVLAPGGRILMLEHVRSSSKLLGLVQDVATPVQRIVASNCHLNRRTVSLVERAGLRLDAVRERWRGMLVELEATAPAELRPI